MALRSQEVQPIYLAFSIDQRNPCIISGCQPRLTSHDQIQIRWVDT